MGIIAFNRDAGVEVFPADAPAPLPAMAHQALDAALDGHLQSLGLNPGVLDRRFDTLTCIVHLGGTVERQDERERIVLCCGNVAGVSGVDDRMTVRMPSAVSRWRFVQPGDTFETIAQDAYRDTAWASALRSANRPLIGDDEAPPAGWLIRIPAVEQMPLARR